MVQIGAWRSITRLDRERRRHPTATICGEVVTSRSIGDHLDEMARRHKDKTVFLEGDTEILFARRVLLVEGPCERYAIPRLCVLAQEELNDTTIISCNGKGNLAHYSLVCRAFGVPFFVLFDLDDDPADEATNQAVVDACGPHPSIGLSSCFEGLLGVQSGKGQKTSKVLSKVADLTKADEIPAEIIEAVRAVSKWSRESDAAS
jgi:predicted ATP-dependent endonuclease of OLD family